MDTETIDARLRHLVGEITGDFSSLQCVSPVEKGMVRKHLRKHGFPLTGVAEREVDNVLRGRELLYFAAPVPLARKHQQFPPSNGDSGGLRHISEIVDEAQELMRESREEVEEYGASTYQLKCGVACPVEQEHFYHSNLWQRRAKACRYLDKWTCRHCNRRPNEPLHVHHMHPIYSEMSRKYHKNFDFSRMQTLCKSCHEKYHARRVRRTWGFEPADKDDKEAERKFFQALRRVHDEKRECEYCQMYVWSRGHSNFRATA